LEDILSRIALLVGLVIGITVHECAHAWSANELGDPTARYKGRVTLNPIAHLDPMGSLLMLYSLLGGFGIGWGKPTPVNPLNLKYGPRLGLAIVSAAGPISNIVVAIIFAIPLRLGVTAGRTGNLADLHHRRQYQPDRVQSVAHSTSRRIQHPARDLEPDTRVVDLSSGRGVPSR